jgi:hypothetical protein
LPLVFGISILTPSVENLAPRSTLDLLGVHDVPADHREDLLAQHREQVDLTS